MSSSDCKKYENLKNELKELKRELETLKMVVGSQRDLLAIEQYRLESDIRKMNAHVGYKPERGGQGVY